MAQIRTFTSSCIFIMIAAAASAQQMPKKPTPQQFAGYYLQQQKKWQTQQLPANSVTYKFSTGSVVNPLYDFNLSKQKPVAAVVLPTTNKLLMNTYQTAPSPSLHLYLMYDRQQMIRVQKQGWWKDPAQAPGTELFRSMFMTNRNNWLYNSMSTIKN